MTDSIGGAIPDELLRLTGSAGEPYEAVSGTGDGGGGYRYYGADRLVQFYQLANEVPSGSPSVVTTIVAAADSSGTSSETIATFSALTATQVTTSGSLAVPPKRSARIPNGKPWVKALNTFSGSGSIVMAVMAESAAAVAP